MRLHFFLNYQQKTNFYQNNTIMKQKISESQALRYFNARKHLGLGVNEAGRKAGINPTRISALENKNVDKPTLEYTNFLVSNGINFEYLMERSENMLTKQEQVEVNSSEIADLQKEIADLKLALSEKSKVLEKTDLENEMNKETIRFLQKMLKG